MGYEEVKIKCQDCKDIKKDPNFPDLIQIKKTGYKIYEDTFSVTFSFGIKEKKLTGIQISLDDKTAPGVAGTAAGVIPLLSSKYGSPSLVDRDDRNGVRSITQQWITNEEVVLAYQAYFPSKFPSYFYINYYPIDPLQRDKL